jgi:ABC-type cobalamin transport system permease subunit
VLYHAAATALAFIHLAFIVFAVFGGLLVLRWRWVMFLHLPAVFWAALIEIEQWNCPLTKWENLALQRAGERGYGNDFVAHHIFGLIYPNGLTRGMEIALAIFVTVVNAVIYHYVRVNARTARRRARPAADRA